MCQKPNFHFFYWQWHLQTPSRPEEGPIRVWEWTNERTEGKLGVRLDYDYDSISDCNKYYPINNDPYSRLNFLYNSKLKIVIWKKTVLNSQKSCVWHWKTVRYSLKEQVPITALCFWSFKRVPLQNMFENIFSTTNKK